MHVCLPHIHIHVSVDSCYCNNNYEKTCTVAKYLIIIFETSTVLVARNLYSYSVATLSFCSKMLPSYSNNAKNGWVV